MDDKETGRLGDWETEDDNGGPFDVPALRACSGSQAAGLREIGFVFSDNERETGRLGEGETGLLDGRGDGRINMMRISR